MKKVFRSQKGITLIALVITIIILMILAGISISLVLGENGIITKAKQAKTTTEQAKQNEEIGLNEATKYIEEMETSGNTILEPTINPTTNELKAGDYIEYNTGVSSVGKNGVITCRVLYDSNSEYGLQIISDKNIENIELGGNDWDTASTSYNNAIQTLNTEMGKYLNTKYVTDARCVGSVPTLQNGTFINKNSETTTTVKLEFTPSGWTTKDSGCKGEDKNYETDQKQMKAINILNTGETYWLASRWADSTSDSTTSLNYEFSIRGVDNEGYVYSYDNLCCLFNDGYPNGYVVTQGIRPCFALKSNIKITEGNGTSEQPYKM